MVGRAGTVKGEKGRFLTGFEVGRCVGSRVLAIGMRLGSGSGVWFSVIGR